MTHICDVIVSFKIILY